MKIKKIISSIIFYSILIIFMLICFASVKSKIDGVQPEILGYKFYIVLTGSMSPIIEQSDLIVVKDVKAEEVKVNDIITFSTEDVDTLVTHRVNEVKTEDEIQFITKGDANDAIDVQPVVEDRLQGKVVKSIPKVGMVINFIKKNLVAIIVFMISIVTIGYSTKFMINKKKGQALNIDNK